MADEFKSVKDEMNGPEGVASGLVPSKWNRYTVADGDWLQNKTLKPLSARDDFLADKIDGINTSAKALVDAERNRAVAEETRIEEKLDTEIQNRIDDVNAEETRAKEEETRIEDNLNTKITDETARAEEEEERIEGLIGQEQTRAQEAEGNLDEAIEKEITDREEADRALAEDIEGLKAATDVISVFGTYAQFIDGRDDLSATDKDFIKVLVDEGRNNAQTYYQSTVTTTTTEPATEEDEPVTTTTTSWNYVTALPPYYDTTTIDDKFNEISATVSNNYLSTKGAVFGSTNIKVIQDANDPKITIETYPDVEFTTVTSNGFSGTNISGLNKTASIDALITSAENGQKTFTGKNYIELFDIEDPSTPAYSYELDTSGAKVSFWVSADKSTNLPMYFTSSDSVPGTNTVVLRVNSNEAKRWLDIDEKLDKEVFDSWSGNTNSQFSGTSRSATIACNAEALGGVTSANIIGSAQSGKAAYNVLSAAKFTATNGSTTTTANLSGGFNLIAGQGIGISHTNGSTGITITAEGTTYTEGNYIDIDNTDNSINVEARLVNSAKSGASAQNYINENARYHIKKINFNSTDGTPTLLDFITSAGTTTTINYSAWKDQPNQSSAFLTVTNDSTNYIRYWSVASSLVLSAVSGKYIYDKYVNTNVQLTGNSTTSYSLSDGLNLVAGDGINLDYNSSNKKITFSVDSNDYIPYSAVEVKTMAGTDNCVGSLASGSNVLKIAATYAYKDENGDRIDTNYVKNSAMNNWITDTNSVFSGTCLSSVNAGSPFPMTGTNGTTAYTHGANCSSFYLSNSVGRAGSVVTFLNNALNFAAYPSTDVSASWYDIINAANAANSKTTCSAIRLSDVAFTHIHLDGFNDLNKISLIGVNYGSKDPLPVTLYSGSRQWNVNVPSGQIIELYKLTYENTESWFETNPISVWNTEQ